MAYKFLFFVLLTFIIYEHSDQIKSTLQNNNLLPTWIKEEDQSHTALQSINQIRLKKGLMPLAWNDDLRDIALLRTQDMTPETLSHEKIVKYCNCGENLAGNQYNWDEVIDDWMHSQGHRANLLYKEYSRVGLGYKDGVYVFVAQ